MEKKKKGPACRHFCPASAAQQLIHRRVQMRETCPFMCFRGMCVGFFLILSINSGVAVKSLVLPVHVPCVFL